MEEHLSRLREKNHTSAAVVKQRHEDQDEMRKTAARRGQARHASEILCWLKRQVPSLFVKEGGIVNDLAMYLTVDRPREDWNGKNYKYLGYITFGPMPEFSVYQFNDLRDVMIREEERGWRNVLLRFIEAGVLTEDQCDREYGRPCGEGSALWFKRLYEYRNQQVSAIADGN